MSLRTCRMRASHKILVRGIAAFHSSSLTARLSGALTMRQMVLACRIYVISKGRNGLSRRSINREARPEGIVRSWPCWCHYTLIIAWSGLPDLHTAISSDAALESSRVCYACRGYPTYIRRGRAIQRLLSRNQYFWQYRDLLYKGKLLCSEDIPPRWTVSRSTAREGETSSLRYPGDCSSLAC